MSTTFDLRGDYTATASLPAYYQRGVIVLDKTFDISAGLPAATTGTVDTTGLAATETIDVFEIPADVLVLSASLTATTGTTATGSETMSFGYDGAATAFVSAFDTSTTGASSTCSDTLYFPVAKSAIVTGNTATITAGVIHVRLICVPA